MPKHTQVLYNGQCPVCSLEIGHYAKYALKEGLPIRFDDLNESDLRHWGIDADTAARRMHVLKDGKLYAGIPAFLVLWEDMPKYRWLAKVIALPGIQQVAVSAYDLMLAPLIYRWHLRRQATRQNR